MDEATKTMAAAPTSEVPPIYDGAVESFSNFMNGNISNGATALLIKVVIPASITLLLLIVAYFVAKFVSRIVAVAVCKRVDQTLGKFAGKFTFYALLIIIGLTILQNAEVPVTGFAAVIAAAGFAIGLAFQGTLSNFASGILLLVFRPFKVGDIVNAAGVMGKVDEIDLFTTTLDTPDNRRLIVPNSSIAGSTIENVTYHKHRRVDVPVGVSYSASLDETRRVLTNCAEAMGAGVVAGEGRGYQIMLNNLGASSVDWTVRVWANSTDYFPMKEKLTAEIKRQLDANGLEIPFPQMQLHLKGNDHYSENADILNQVLPMPKMSSVAPQAGTAARVRPRVRGGNANIT